MIDWTVAKITLASGVLLMLLLGSLHVSYRAAKSTGRPWKLPSATSLLLMASGVWALVDVLTIVAIFGSDLFAFGVPMESDLRSASAAAIYFGIAGALLVVGQVATEFRRLTKEPRRR